LELWKVDSRIRLLAARMTMSEDPALEGELKAVLHGRLQIRLQQLRAEQERLAARAARVSEMIADFERDPEGRIERDLNRIRRSIRTSEAAKPADGQPPRRRTGTNPDREPVKKDR
jgi:hypothetical protein